MEIWVYHTDLEFDDELQGYVETGIDRQAWVTNEMYIEMMTDYYAGRTVNSWEQIESCRVAVGKFFI